MTSRDPIDEAGRALPRHGGALLAAAARYGIAPSDWLDLSTGINPDPWPIPPLPGATYHRLPEPDDLAALISAARSAYRVDAGLAIVAVPGSDIALRLIPALRPAGRVGIIAPTYGGHAEGWRRAGHGVTSLGRLAEAGASEPADALVLVNPNNPDGRHLAPSEIVPLLGRLPEDGLLVVDEAFADLDEAMSLAGRIEDERVVLLRSFGKFYGLAGLRLGFVIGKGTLVERLAALMGDWPVSGPAIAIGRAALADTAWQEATRLRLADRRARLDAVLAANGLTVAGGTDLFRFVRHTEARSLHESLARDGIWTRIFAELPDAIRIGLPRAADVDRLAAGLARWSEAPRTRGRS